MYKKEAAAFLVILSGIWMDYELSQKTIPSIALIMLIYWFARTVYTDYQKE